MGQVRVANPIPPLHQVVVNRKGQVKRKAHRNAIRGVDVAEDKASI